MDYKIVCTECGHEEGQSAFRCGSCNSILEVRFDYHSFRLPANFRSKRISTLKYLDFLPIKSMKIKGGEGNTPIVRKTMLSEGIMLKLETMNPTHSFKDRGSVVEINKAIELGFGSLCCASTGNMGISVARYSKLAGIAATIFISKNANKMKIEMIREHGADIVMVNGDFNEALKEAERFAVRTGAFVCGDYHYRKEGQKTLIFEMAEQLKYAMPDFVFAPVGNATLLAAMYKGMLELKRFSLIKKLPRIVAVQSELCNPLVRAYNSGRKIEYVKPETEADAIAVGYPTFGFEGIRALKDTRGIGVSVSEKEIWDSVSMLGDNGIKSGPGGAAGLAGFAKLYRQDRRLLLGKSAVILVTGSNWHE